MKWICFSTLIITVPYLESWPAFCHHRTTSYLRKSFLLYANWKDVALAKPPSSQATKETSTMQSYISACSDFPNILFI